MDSNTFAIDYARPPARKRRPGRRRAHRSGVWACAFCDRQLINLAAEQSGLCSELFERADEKRSRGLFSAPDRLPACALRRRRRRGGQCAERRDAFQGVTERRDPRAGLARVIVRFRGPLRRLRPARPSPAARRLRVGLACRRAASAYSAGSTASHPRRPRGDDGPRGRPPYAAHDYYNSRGRWGRCGHLTICSIELVGARHRGRHGGLRARFRGPEIGADH